MVVLWRVRFKLSHSMEGDEVHGWVWRWACRWVQAISSIINGSLFVLYRVTEQATRTATPLFKRKPNTKARWRFRPQSQRLCLRRMASRCPPCGSTPRSSKRRRPAGSTRPTPTCGSTWLTRSRGAWAAPGPRPQ